MCVTALLPNWCLQSVNPPHSRRDLLNSHGHRRNYSHIAHEGAPGGVCSRRLHAVEIPVARGRNQEDWPGHRGSRPRARGHTQKSLRRCSNADIPHINALANSVVPMVPPFERTADDIEAQFYANHVGHCRFTNLFLPKLPAAPASVVLNVTSTHTGSARESLERRLGGNAVQRVWRVRAREMHQRPLIRLPRDTGRDFRRRGSHPLVRLWYYAEGDSVP